MVSVSEPDVMSQAPSSHEVSFLLTGSAQCTCAYRLKRERRGVPVGESLDGIDSNKIEQAHHLPRFLGLGPLPARTVALGVAHGVARAQGLWRCWGDPGGIHKRGLHLDACTGPNQPQLAPQPSQRWQRRDAPL